MSSSISQKSVDCGSQLAPHLSSCQIFVSVEHSIRGFFLTASSSFTVFYCDAISARDACHLKHGQCQIRYVTNYGTKLLFEILLLNRMGLNISLFPRLQRLIVFSRIMKVDGGSRCVLLFRSRLSLTGNSEFSQPY